jgi:microcystin-dependent protein
VTQPYIGQIQQFGFNFAPRNWAFCNGATIAISQNEALFSILGTTYGGNGTTTFGLPNTQDRSVMNWGQGTGLTNYTLGEVAGADSVTLTTAEMPTHNHTLYATGGSAAELTPTQNGWFGIIALPGKLFSTAAVNTQMSPNQLMKSGGSQPHENDQPYIGTNFCVALFGIFPSRN